MSKMNKKQALQTYRWKMSWWWWQCLPCEIKDWTFTWPRGTKPDDCDVEITNKDLPRLKNNWIKFDDGAVNFTVNNDIKSVSVKLRNINTNRVTRVVINDNLKNMCFATNCGMFLVDGDYGAQKALNICYCLE